MKQLILTFFAVILFYSLFFNDKKEKPAVDKLNYIYEGVSISDTNYMTFPDTLNYQAFNTDNYYQPAFYQVSK